MNKKTIIIIAIIAIAVLYFMFASKDDQQQEQAASNGNNTQGGTTTNNATKSTTATQKPKSDKQQKKENLEASVKITNQLSNSVKEKLLNMAIEFNKKTNSCLPVYVQHWEPLTKLSKQEFYYFNTLLKQYFNKTYVDKFRPVMNVSSRVAKTGFYKTEFNNILWKLLDLETTAKQQNL